MKKIVLCLSIVLISSVTVTAQILGSGTLADPYHGINAGNFTIIGTKYFNATIGVSSGKLKCNPGSKLISLVTTAQVSITGTGQLEVNGNASNTVLFSVDIDKDGIFGEAGEYWGNVYLTSSGTSTLDYAIIERGQRLGTRIAALGGGIYMGGTGSVTLNHCTIRNCTAYKGGAICVASGVAPTISNTLFSSNTANDHGGAIYISATSAPVISNCIFRSNNSLSTTLYGGTIASISGSPRVINSDITYSTSSASTGKSVYLENSTNAVFVNTIIWGGSNHISLSGTPSTVFYKCAIEGETYANCLTLSSVNTDPTGPNFVNPVTGNYNITYNSPLRDAGVDSYTGVTIPTTDYAGNARAWTTDIGAYEMIYSRWTGTSGTDWTVATNWSGSHLPGTTRNVVIPAGLTNYPTTATAFTLSSGLKMIMEPGSRASFTTLANNGSIYLQSDANGIASLMANSFTGTSGSLNINLFVTGGLDVGTGEYRWHYIATTASVPKTVFTDIDPYNLLNWNEGAVIDDISQGWQWHDGYDNTTAFNTLEPKQGYDIYVDNDTTIPFTGMTSMTTSMGQINLPYSGRTTDTSLYGYSFIGNSLTCGINWDQVTRSSTTYVRNAIYITKNGVAASYVNGVGTNGGTAHIPPLQGFFVKTRATGTYITIPDGAREHNSTARYKSASVSSIPLIRLQLITRSLTDEAVIRLDKNGTLDFDGEYDAGKIFGPVDNIPMIYSVLKGEVYSINTIPWPESKTVIPLTLKVPEEGSYKIRCTELQNLDAIATLTDNMTGKTINLSVASSYSFESKSGTINGRFVVTIYSNAPVTKINPYVPDEIKIYSAGEKICVLPTGNVWDGTRGKVRIFDITGRLIYNGQEEEFYSGVIKEYEQRFNPGIIIVEVSAGNKKFREKLIISK